MKDKKPLFRPLSLVEFRDLYPEALTLLVGGGLHEEFDDVPEWVAQLAGGAQDAVTHFGQVKVPGYGWHGCVTNDLGKVTHFYSDDDGWQPAP